MSPARVRRVTRVNKDFMTREGVDVGERKRFRVGRIIGRVVLWIVATAESVWSDYSVENVIFAKSHLAEEPWGRGSECCTYSKAALRWCSRALLSLVDQSDCRFCYSSPHIPV